MSLSEIWGCDCGVTSYGLCMYCGGNLFIDIIIFVLVFVFMLFYFIKNA